MPWYDTLRTSATKHEYFNSREEAIKAKARYPRKKTRISKFKDYKDKRGVWHYKYALNIFGK